jgi:hypothetical protein
MNAVDYACKTYTVRAPACRLQVDGIATGLLGRCCQGGTPTFKAAESADYSCARNTHVAECTTDGSARYGHSAAPAQTAGRHMQSARATGSKVRHSSARLTSSAVRLPSIRLPFGMVDHPSPGQQPVLSICPVAAAPGAPQALRHARDSGAEAHACSWRLSLALADRNASLALAD